MVGHYFMIFVQSSKLFHVGMERKEGLSKMKISSLDSFEAISYYTSMPPNLYIYPLLHQNGGYLVWSKLFMTRTYYSILFTTTIGYSVATVVHLMVAFCY